MDKNMSINESVSCGISQTGSHTVAGESYAQSSGKGGFQYSGLPEENKSHAQSLSEDCSRFSGSPGKSEGHSWSSREGYIQYSGEKESHSYGCSEVFRDSEVESHTCGISRPEERTAEKCPCFSMLREKEEDIKDMSYVHAVKKFNRIILSSDSRIVLTNGNGWIVSFSDSFQKIVYLPKTELGIISAGLNCIGDTLLPDLLLSLDSKWEHGETSVYKKFSYITKEIKARLPKDEVVHMACGGFNEGDAILLYSDIRCDQAIINESDYLWYNNGTIIKTLENPETHNIDVNILDVQSLIDFSDFLVESEIKRSRFANRFPVIGGPVQSLLLEPDGPKWLRKL